MEEQKNQKHWVQRALHYSTQSTLTQPIYCYYYYYYYYYYFYYRCCCYCCYYYSSCIGITQTLTPIHRVGVGGVPPFSLQCWLGLA